MKDICREESVYDKVTGILRATGDYKDRECRQRRPVRRRRESSAVVYAIRDPAATVEMNGILERVTPKGPQAGGVGTPTVVMGHLQHVGQHRGDHIALIPLVLLAYIQQ